MLQKTNLLSLIQAMDSLGPEGFEEFKRHYRIQIRDDEIDDLRVLIDVLIRGGCSVNDLDGFYLGYKIPQIGKEFDLLLVGLSGIVNVEIKRRGDAEKVRKQLLRNSYYLKATGRNIFHFSFVCDDEEIFTLDDNGEFLKSSVDVLCDVIKNHLIGEMDNVDGLFDPSDYLVSPFNYTEKFLRGEYFLTHQQEDVKGQIEKIISGSKGASFISITGGAGTGKTLLTYDIIKAFLPYKSTLIIHCGQLNEGHKRLIDSGWKIDPIRNLNNIEFSKVDLVVVDEAQRLYQRQFERINGEIEKNKKICIFSHDRLQTLSNKEEWGRVSGKIPLIEKVSTYKLSEKIRSNKEVAEFIKMLFDKNRSVLFENKGNIRLEYFSDIESAVSFLESLRAASWNILRYTPSQYDNEYHEEYSPRCYSTSHEVIGQEFDNVAVVVDKFFTYDKDGLLSYLGRSYYLPSKMLFQNITRARKMLTLVIVENEELFRRCVAILR
ncbi:DUF2075 domain-containing protein [Thalassospira sp. NFXS8]|uniref:DNA/RNA helicase domain-containing protein n=1 Tax=Thalassospira sp. NFXS8 TaxID=2819093 RepID=UPI0032DF9E40